MNSNGEMAPVKIEPRSIKEMEQTTEYRNSLAILQESRFLPFLQKNDGFNSIVALAFAQTFDGSRAKVGSLEFAVTKESIS